MLSILVKKQLLLGLKALISWTQVSMYLQKFFLTT